MQDRFEKRIKLTSEIVGKIAKIDEFKGLWRGSIKLSPQIMGRLKRSAIITSTGASTRIEGASLDDEEVDHLLRGLKTKPPKNRDEQEVAGYADLLGRIFDNHKSLKLSENNILHFHSILLQYSEKDTSHRGKYKQGDNTVIARNSKGEEVILFNPTKPYLVKPEMNAVMDWTNQKLESGESHPLFVIGNFVFEFLAIHPFIDGNGRLSRVLTNLLLLRSGYSYIPYVSLDEIIEDRKEAYYLSLRATQKKHKTKIEDITPWLVFFLDSLLKQVENAKKIMNKEQPEKLLSEKQEKILGLFSQEEILSVSQIDTLLKKSIPQATIKQALKRMVELGILERLGQGRGVRYKKK